MSPLSGHCVLIVIGMRPLSTIWLIGGQNPVIRQHQKLALQMPLKTGTQRHSTIEVFLSKQMSESMDGLNVRKKSGWLVFSSNSEKKSKTYIGYDRAILY